TIGPGAFTQPLQDQTLQRVDGVLQRYGCGLRLGGRLSIPSRRMRRHVHQPNPTPSPGLSHVPHIDWPGLSLYDDHRTARTSKRAHLVRGPAPAATPSTSPSSSPVHLVPPIWCAQPAWGGDAWQEE